MNAPSDHPAIETRGLTKIYGSGNTEVRALRDVTFTLNRGEVVALLGPSGSGKSTLLGIVGLINAPTRGEVMLDGTPVYRDARALVDVRRYRRERIGFVFQKSNLIPFLSARENVQVALEIAGASGRNARRRSMELLETLGLSDRAHHLPRALSGGQQQRVAIARALANRPSLMLADEPTAALDSERGRQVMGLFRDLGHQQGAGVLVVTHDHRALDVFDRVLEMEDGLLRDATVSDLTAGATNVGGSQPGEA